jgi:hypothetical protein
MPGYIDDKCSYIKLNSRYEYIILLTNSKYFVIIEFNDAFHWYFCLLTLVCCIQRKPLGLWGKNILIKWKIIRGPYEINWGPWVWNLCNSGFLYHIHIYFTQKNYRVNRISYGPVLKCCQLLATRLPILTNSTKLYAAVGVHRVAKQETLKKILGVVRITAVICDWLQ